MITENDIGKRVKITRKPTIDDWRGIGRVSLDDIKKLPELIISEYHNLYIRVKGNMYAYPIVIFELINDKIYEIY